MTSNLPDDDRTVIRGGGTPTAPPSGYASTYSSTGPATTSQAASSAGDSGNALAMGTFLGEFELTSVLGEGGFGIVYQAWDHSLERKVALKEYMPSSLAARTGATQVQVKSERHRETFELGRKSFINEAKLLAQFDHPSLVKVYRFWEANGTAYMVMPLYDGITLKDHLKTLSAPPDEAWMDALLAPLTEALAVIHAEHCFHRDIAPDNVILLAGSGRPLLLDFGAARRVIGDMTQALTVILKPGYAPIEQYAEAPHMKQGAWTDIYALAATVHFCLIGKTPPPSVSRMMSDTYEPLAQSLAGRYSERFLGAIDRALIVKPDERTQNITALRADFGFPERQGDPTSSFGRASTFGDSTLSPPSVLPQAMAPERASVPAPRSKMPLIGAAALVLLGGGGWAAYRMSQQSPAPAVAAAPAVVPSPTSLAAAPASAPVEAAPAPHFDAQAQFDRVLGSQTAGFSVQAQAAKSTLRIGKDSLGFSVSATRAGYVQVLLLGPDGSLLQLFPNSKAKAQRIEPGQTLKLPQAGWPLDASDPAGAETFLVVVSQQPRDYSALSTERDDMFLTLPTGARADSLLAQWKLPTPLLLGTAPQGCQGADCDSYGAAQFTVNVTK